MATANGPDTVGQPAQGSAMDSSPSGRDYNPMENSYSTSGRYLPMTDGSGRKQPPAYEIHVSNIPLSLTEDGLLNLCVEHCQVIRVFIHLSPKTEHHSTKSGFVTVATAGDAAACISALDGVDVGGGYRLKMQLSFRHNDQLDQEEGRLFRGFHFRLPPTVTRESLLGTGSGDSHRSDGTHDAAEGSNGKAGTDCPSRSSSSSNGSGATVVTGRSCTRCGKPGDSRCAHCKLPYCSRSCQQDDWPTHRKTCRTSTAHTRPGDTSNASQTKPPSPSATKAGPSHMATTGTNGDVTATSSTDDSEPVATVGELPAANVAIAEATGAGPPPVLASDTKASEQQDSEWAISAGMTDMFEGIFRQLFPGALPNESDDLQRGTGGDSICDNASYDGINDKRSSGLNHVDHGSLSAFKSCPARGYTVAATSNSDEHGILPRQVDLLGLNACSATSFWARSASAAAENSVQSLHAEMAGLESATMQSGPVPCSQQGVGGLYAVRALDNSLQRGRLLTAPTQDQHVTAALIDAGRNVTVDCNGVFPLPSRLGEDTAPAAAMLVSLDGIRPVGYSKNKAGLVQLNKLVHGQRLTATILRQDSGRSNSTAYARVLDGTGRSINELVAQTPFAAVLDVTGVTKHDVRPV